MMDNFKSFKDWLRFKVVDSGESVTKMTKEIGVNRSLIYMHIDGSVIPSRKTLKLYADYFGADYWELYELTIPTTKRHI